VAIDPATHPGAVKLTVADAAGVADFYENTVGLERLADDALGAGGRPLVELNEAPQAPPRPSGTTGLFHLAILVPTRADLGTALRRLVAAGWGLTGASDHLVSEALYLDDPEGNGIEIYRDRPREEWPYVDGQLQIATLPLDLTSIAAEAAAENAPMAAGTTIGHVHLNVADIDDSRRFYVDALGFDVTADSYMGALFVSAGGYHHHLGLNIWNGAGAPPPPAGSRGLDRFELIGVGELDPIAERLSEHGFDAERDGDVLESADPSGNRVTIRKES
jgi:catechol 2,3-dioxygenase